MTTVVRGPAWSRSGLDLAESRYPLRVERHVSRLVESLLPGVITTTPHARSYALHTLVWAEARSQDLDYEQSIALMRRAEVVLAGITLAHTGNHAFPLGQPHGGAIVESSIHQHGVLEVAELAEQDRYSRNRLGFGGVYLGSEVVLGMAKAGRPPTPGPRADETQLRPALEQILALAAHDRLSLAETAGHPDLCLCGAQQAPDGEWLRRVLLAPPATAGVDTSADSARTETALLLARVVSSGAARDSSTASVASAFRTSVGFGEFITDDPIAAQLASAGVWRGVILRNYSVGAWRRIWSWLIEQLGEPLTPTSLAELFADSLPAITVGQLVDEVAQGGLDEPLEEDLRIKHQAPDPLTELRLLALGARRLEQLDGRALQAFAGSQRADDLGPYWFAAQLDTNRDRSLRDYARELTHGLVDRALRIALTKTQLDSRGRVWMPSRIVDRGGLILRRSREGWADVGLRIDTFSSVLLGCGVLGVDDDGWYLSDVGASALG